MCLSRELLIINCNHKSELLTTVIIQFETNNQFLAILDNQFLIDMIILGKEQNKF